MAVFGPVLAETLGPPRMMASLGELVRLLLGEVGPRSLGSGRGMVSRHLPLVYELLPLKLQGQSLTELALRKAVAVSRPFL